MAAETERMQTEQRNAALSALSMAQAAINGLNDESTDAQVTAARDLVTAAQDALDVATGLSQSERDGLTSLVTTASTSVTGYETIVEARPDPAVVAANTKAAETKEEAIEDEDKQPAHADNDIGGTANAANYSMTIERPRVGSTVIKIADTDNPADADPPSPQFTQAMVLGEGRTMHTRVMEADDDGDVVEEVVIVRTDIQAAKATLFAKVAGQALDARDLDIEVNADRKGSAIDDYTALTVKLGGSPDETAAVLKLVKSPKFTAGTVATLEFPYKQADTNVNDNVDDSVAAFEGPGTYNGSDGTYRCDGAAACTVMLNAKGMITTMSGVWIFTPAPGVTSDVPDADFMHYGAWLQKTTDEDSVVEYDEVETFAESSIDKTDSVDAVIGSATYEGGATGVYVHAVTNSDGTRASATSVTSRRMPS